MRLAAPLLLLGTGLALAGCNGASDAKYNESEAAARGVAPDREAVLRDRWSKLFADPAAVVKAANEFGYAVPGYAQAGSGYRAEGKPQVLPAADAPITVKTDFLATGAKADRVESIEFTFDVAVNGKANSGKEADAARIPSRIVRGFLSRFDVGPGDAVNTAINQQQPVTAPLPGATIRVDALRAAGAPKGAAQLLVRIAPATNPQDSTARK